MLFCPESVQVLQWQTVFRLGTSRALKRLKYKDEVQSMETRIVDRVWRGGETPGKYSYRMSEVKLLWDVK